MSTVASVAVPFASTMVGAGVTYAVNVRHRRRTYVEDLVNAAIAAVAAAEASVDFLASAGPSPHMTDEDYEAFQSWLVTEGMKRWATNVADANVALARVIPYRPVVAELLPFSPDSQHRGTGEPIIEALREPT